MELTEEQRELLIFANTHQVLPNIALSEDEREVAMSLTKLGLFAYRPLHLCFKITEAGRQALDLTLTK